MEHLASNYSTIETMEGVSSTDLNMQNFFQPLEQPMVDISVPEFSTTNVDNMNNILINNNNNNNNNTIESTNSMVSTTSYINIPGNIVTENNDNLVYTGECYQRDGKFYMIFQNGKGERTEFLCETNVQMGTDTALENAIESIIVSDMGNSSCTVANPPMENIVNTNINLEQVPVQDEAKINEVPMEIEPITTTAPLTEFSNVNLTSTITTNGQTIPTDVNISEEEMPKIEINNVNNEKFEINLDTAKNEPEPINNNAKKIQEIPAKNDNVLPKEKVSETGGYKPQLKSCKTTKSNIVWLTSCSFDNKEEMPNKPKLTTTIEPADPNWVPLPEIVPKTNKILSPVYKKPPIFPVRKNIIFQGRNEHPIVINPNNMNKINEIKNKSINSNLPEPVKSIPLKPILSSSNLPSPSKVNNHQIKTNEVPASVNSAESKDELKIKKKISFNEIKTPTKENNNNDKIKKSNNLTNEINTYLKESSKSKSLFHIDRRTAYDKCDYLLKNGETRIFVRTQPEDRNEQRMGTVLTCAHCNFQTKLNLLLSLHAEEHITSANKPEQFLYLFNYDNIPKKPTKILKSNNDEDLDSLSEDDDDIDNDNDKKSDTEDNQKLKTLEGFTQEEVVWTVTKIGHWPALILDIVENNFILRLIDYPLPDKFKMKCKSSLMTHFNKESMDRYLKDYATKNDLKDKLVKTLQKIEDYLRKRLLDEPMDYVKFFNFVELLLTNK